MEAVTRTGKPLLNAAGAVAGAAVAPTSVLITGSLSRLCRVCYSDFGLLSGVEACVGGGAARFGSERSCWLGGRDGTTGFSAAAAKEGDDRRTEPGPLSAEVRFAK